MTSVVSGSLESLLFAEGQEHLIPYVQGYSSASQEKLVRQLYALDWELLRVQRALIKDRRIAAQASQVQPLLGSSCTSEHACPQQGLDLLRKGKVATLLIAGGQGSRLGFAGPKGAVEVDPKTRKSLFELHAEKVVALGRFLGTALPLALMTSPQNSAESQAFFEEHQYFGLDREDLDFFNQSELPILDEEGRLLLKEEDQLCLGPDGNGAAFCALQRSGILEKWRQRGVEWVQWILVDNPLGIPFDPRLAAYHARMGCDVLIKACERQDPSESVGLLVRRRGGGPAVIEYSELPDDLRHASSRDGSLLFPLANISLFSFTLDFLEQLTKREMPLHLAHKAVSSLQEDGSIGKPSSPNAWKFERFVFDCLDFATSSEVLVYPREQCFAPLKNAKGKDSLATLQRKLALFEARCVGTQGQLCDPLAYYI